MFHSRFGRYNSWFILGGLGVAILEPLAVNGQSSAFTDEPRALQVVERSLDMRQGQSLSGFLALPESTLELEIWRAHEENDAAQHWLAQTFSRVATLPDSELKALGARTIGEQGGILLRYALAAQVSRDGRLRETALALANEVGSDGEPQGSKPKDAARMVEALSELYSTTLDATVLKMAENVAQRLWSNLKHDYLNSKETEAQRALFASEVATACLSLYEVTAERLWSTRASQAFEQVRDARSHIASLDDASMLGVVRTAIRLFRYTGDSAADEIARLGIAKIQDKTEGSPADVASLLLAKREFAIEPAHVTVVGSKQDDRARALWRESLKVPAVFARREWLDRSEGSLPRNDATFPALSTPAAYVCVQKRCSLPLFTEEELRAKLTQAFPPL
jgi:hypothetical protein